MADIFISYSKPDRDKVVMLAAYFESEGYKVWWDTNLAIGDMFRDEIMKQLAMARAVIVVCVDRRPIVTHHRRAPAPSLPALRCAARLQPWRCGLTT